MWRGKHSLWLTAPWLALAVPALMARGAAAQQREVPFEAYKPSYFLAGYDNVTHSGRKNEEAKFQFSIRKQPWDGLPLFFGYTQQSFWQVFDAQKSAPFRESNYNPEAFFRPAPSKWLGLDVTTQLGVEHQSNGQPVGTSRSWNRYYLWPQVRFPHQNRWRVSFKWWGRVDEETKADPTLAEGDDNPGILNYLGNGELYLTVPLQQAHQFFLMARRGTKGRYGAQRLDYFWQPPFFRTRVFLHAQFFTGYGESLIDFDVKTQRLSIGFAFSNAAGMLGD